MLPTPHETEHPWKQTVSGLALNLLDPQPDQIVLDDIAYSLANQNRYDGHCEPIWSVAAHSVLCTLLLPQDASPNLALAVLLHDAHEWAVGDLGSPVKKALKAINPAAMDTWNTLVGIIQRPIHVAFDLPVNLPSHWIDQIKHVDLWALRLERDRVMRPSKLRWIVEDMTFPPTPPLFDVGDRSVWELAGEPDLAEDIFPRTFDHYDQLRNSPEKA